MAVLIDMEMPKCCERCPCISGYGRMCLAAHNRRFTKTEHSKNISAVLHETGYRPRWCPVVEVPEQEVDNG